MCGAVSIQYDPASMLRCGVERNGEIVFAYWDKRPLLPVRQGNMTGCRGGIL